MPSNLISRLNYLKNIHQSLGAGQTNFVPGFLASGICKIVAFSISSSQARSNIITNDTKLVEFLENLMLACITEIQKVNPQQENSFIYFNISQLVGNTFKKYPTLNQKVSAIIFENVAQNVFKQILLPAIQAQYSAQELVQIQSRYGQVLLYFKAQIPSLQSRSKLAQLQIKLNS